MAPPIEVEFGSAEEGNTMEKVDVAPDLFQSIMQESMSLHDVSMSGTVSNIQHVHNIARNVGVKKMHEVDPLEAAAAELVLRVKPLK